MKKINAFNDLRRAINSTINNAIPKTRICTVIDWGTQTTGEPLKITRHIHRTKNPDVYELITPSSENSGLYSNPEIIVKMSTDELRLKYGYQLIGIKL